jgi:hypothetical protein
MDARDKQILDTQELLRMIQSSSSLDTLLDGYYDNTRDPGLAVYLEEMLSAHSCTIPQVVRQTVLSKSYVYQIFNGSRCPDRDSLLKIAFAMELTCEETQRLLTISQRGLLYPKVRRDAAIIFCLQKKCTLMDTSELLESIGEISLFKRDGIL